MEDNILRWVAWYADGNVYNSTEIKWEDLPDDGVVTVAVYGDLIPGLPEKKRYRRVMDGDNWYFFLEDTIICNNDPMEENKKRYPEAKHFKRGMWVSDAQFKAISDKAWESSWLLS